MEPVGIIRRYRGCFTAVKHSCERSVPASRRIVTLAWLLLALWTLNGQTVSAQVSDADSQSFEVYVPPTLTGRVAIQGPVDIRIIHDGTDNLQTFADQRWAVGCNNARGANVTFETRSAFTLRGGGKPVKRDALVQLGILTAEAAANWTITKSSAQTNYRGGIQDERVTVTAESSAPGDAVFNVRVHFITEDFTSLRQGDYDMRLVGTITAK